MANTEPVQSAALADFARRHSRAGLLVRYSRGRVSRFLERQWLAAAGSSALAYFNGWEYGFFAFMVALTGEALDCTLLRRLPEWLKAGVPEPRLYFLSACTATIQSMSIAFCFFLTSTGDVTRHSVLFAMSFLIGAAINAGVMLPFHRAAGFARLAVYAVCPLAWLVFFTFNGDVSEPRLWLDLMGVFILAFMAAVFIGYVNAGFERQKTNTRKLVENAQLLEQANADLKHNEKEMKQLSLVARNANDSVIISNSDGKIEWVNDAFVRATGYETTEAIGESPGALLNAPETDPVTIAAIRSAIREGRSFRGEILNRRKDGRDIWVDTNLVPVIGSDGTIEMTVAIERDVTFARIHAEEMAKARRAAEEGAKAKSDFLATMSHEIRTPMNGIVGMADLLVESGLSAEQRSFSETIRNSAQSLLQIINDILDLSKLEASKMSFEEAPFDAAQCLTEVLQLMETQATAKGIELSLVIADGFPEFVMADPGRLRQVLFNLIGNAVKFTSEGRVDVHASAYAEPHGWRLVLRISDTGIGIAEDKMGQIFDRFSQADAATTRRFGGTGLGLTISKHLVEAMGGTIAVTSKLGVGSVFEIDLPVRAAALPATDPVPSPKTDEDLFSQINGAHVLVAEDNKVNRLLISKYLKNSAVKLTFACDGKEAVAAAQAQAPDLIFMDMSMPVMSGVDATRAIRARDGPQPVILALTANAFDSDRMACLEAGMDGFLTKPIRRREFLEAIADHAHRT